MYCIKKIGAFSALVLSFSFTGYAQAQILPTAYSETPPGCSFGAQIRNLAETQNKLTPEESEGASTELQIRKSLISDILGCANKEINNLKQFLFAPGIEEDRGLKTFRDRLLVQLDKILEYYKLQKSEVETLNILGTKERAKEILKQRSLVQAPVVEQANNLVLWNRNYELIAAAEHRFAYIKQTVRKTNLTENQEIAGLIRNAESNLQNTAILHRRSKQSLITPTLAGDFPYLTRASLETLASLYRNFFEIGNTINDILSG